MNNILTYKDYIGTVNFSEEDGVFFGKVFGITDSISFEGDTVESLIEDSILPSTNTSNSARRPARSRSSSTKAASMSASARSFTARHRCSRRRKISR